MKEIALLRFPDAKAKEYAIHEGHLYAFDYYHPVKNFLHHAGVSLSTYDEIRKRTEEEEVPAMHVSDEVRDAAREFLRLWIELIENARMGSEQRVETTLLGSVKVGYDIGTI